MDDKHLYPVSIWVLFPSDPESDRTAKVTPGLTIAEALATLGITLNMPCGGEGSCGKCTVGIRDLDDFDAEFTQVSACRTLIETSVEIEVPDTALLDDEIRILTTHHHEAAEAGSKAEEAERKELEPTPYGIAVDVGTTTLAALLVDRRDGTTREVASMLNPQTRLGDDVVARIQHCIDKESGLEELHRHIIEAVDSLIGELTTDTGVDRKQIGAVTIAGNTTMQHIFSKIDVRGLAQLPFAPAFHGSQLFTAKQIGLNIADDASVYVLPIIEGFVGGDTVAGIFTRRNRSTANELLIDIGTNGEIALFAGNRIFAAAAAAGPAFEGARIHHGMRAQPGAIERFVFDENADGGCIIETIGSVAPRGICGSGLIDIAAEALRAGIVKQNGQMLTADSPELPPSLPESIRKRLITFEGRAALLLADEKQSGTGKPVVLTQVDIRQLQLAAGAIRAGVTILLRKAGLDLDDIEEVHLAGGFGNFIHRSNAQRIGLLPHAYPVEQIRYLGNTALSGALLVLLKPELRDEMEFIASQTDHVDLAGDPEFQITFADAMIFPG